MNGKLKNKVMAIFAVAMMIMVACVPMVSVFTDDGDAAPVVIVPEDSVLVSISGTVYDGEGKPFAGVQTVVDNGAVSPTAYGTAITDSEGKYTVSWYVEEFDNENGYSYNVYVNTTSPNLGTGDDAYPNPARDMIIGGLEFTGVKEKSISGADMYTGYVTISGSIYYSNKTPVLFEDAEKDDLTIETAKVDDTKEQGTAAATTNWIISIKDGSFNIQVPVDVADAGDNAVWVLKAYGGEVKLSQKITASASGKNITAANLYVLKVTSADEVQLTLNISGDLNDSNIAKVSDSMKAVAKEHVFTYSLIDTVSSEKSYDMYLSEETKLGADMTVTAAVKSNTNKVNYNEVVYVADRYVHGTLTLNKDSVADEVVTIDFYKAGAEGGEVEKINNASLTDTTDAEGKFKIFYGEIPKDAVSFTVWAFADINDEENDVTVALEKAGVYNSTLKADLKYVEDTFVKVSFSVINDKGVEVEGAEVVIESLSGDHYNVLTSNSSPSYCYVTTDAKGKAYVLVKSGFLYTFSVEGCTIASQDHIVVDDVTISFTMETYEVGNATVLEEDTDAKTDATYATPIVDAFDEPLEGATVTYGFEITPANVTEGTDATFKGTTYTVETDENGYFVIDLDAFRTIYDIYVIVSAEDLTFDDEPVLLSTLMETEGEVIAPQEVKYEISLTSNSNPIVDLTGITVSVGVYKVTYDGTTVNVYDRQKSITLSTETTTTQGVECITYYFVATAPENGYMYAAEVSVDTSKTSHRFNAFTLIEDNETEIADTSSNIDGKIFESDEETPIKIAGATINAYDINKELVATTQTIRDGSYIFQLNATQAASVKYYTVSGAAPYTFDDEGNEYISGSLFTDALIANEKTQTFVNNKIQDALGAEIMNADITIGVYDSKGNLVGSTVKVKADGTYADIITNLEEGYEVRAVDNNKDVSKKYTFNSVYVEEQAVGSGQPSETELVVPTIRANEANYIVEVKGNNKSLVGVEVSIVKYNDAADTVITTGTTTKDGVSFFLALESGYGYKAVAKDIPNGYTFNADAVNGIASGKATIYASNKAVIATLDASLVEYDLETSVSFKDASIEFFTKSGNNYISIGKYTVDENNAVTWYTVAGYGGYYYAKVSGTQYTFVDSEDGIKKLTGIADATNITIDALDDVFTANAYIGGLGKTDEVPIEGVNINFLDAKGAVVGVANTNVLGDATFIGYGVESAKALDINMPYGVLTFSNESEYELKADQYLYYGNYAMFGGKALTLNDVKVTGSVAFDGQVVYTQDAKVVDDKYYLLLDPKTIGVSLDIANATADITISVESEGFVGSTKIDNSALKLRYDVTVDSTQVEANVNLTSVTTSSTGHFAASKTSGVKTGDVITLYADNAYFDAAPGASGVLVEYKFAGWYVNGVKVSDDLVYNYTVTGDCSIEAKYDASLNDTNPAPAAEKGVDPIVIVLGIAAVVVAILALAYIVLMGRKA